MFSMDLGWRRASHGRSINDSTHISISIRYLKIHIPVFNYILQLSLCLPSCVHSLSIPLSLEDCKLVFGVFTP